MNCVLNLKSKIMNTKDLQTPAEIQNLMSDLKSEDRKYKNTMKGAEFLGWTVAVIMAVSHLIILLLPGKESILHEIYMGGSYVVAFIIYALYFRYLKNSYDKIDYSLPALDMLKKVANNKKFFKPRLVILFIPILIIAVNMSISITGRFNIDLFHSDIHNLLFVIACFILLMGIVGLISYIKHNKKHKLLRNRAIALIEDMEKDTSY